MDSNDTTHHHWLIRTVTGYDNPEDWRSGDPDRYIVRGYAQFPPNGIDGFSWTDLTPIEAQSRHFTNKALERRFHAEVIGMLQDAIDARRHPEW